LALFGVAKYAEKLPPSAARIVTSAMIPPIGFARGLCLRAANLAARRGVVIRRRAAAVCPGSARKDNPGR
jgi:hypothetical protein